MDVLVHCVFWCDRLCENGSIRGVSKNVRRLTKAFFCPRVAVVVVTVPFPETGAIMSHKFEAIDPFGTFPGIELRHDEAQWPAVFGREWFAVSTVCEDNVVT